MRARLATALLGLALLPGCTARERGRVRIVEARAPAAIASDADPLSPEARFPIGSQVLAGGEPITEGFAAAGGPAIGWGGQRLALAARERGGFRVWILDLDGGDRLAVSREGCSDPDWLPDGGLVYACAVEGGVALFTHPAGALDQPAAAQRITFGAGFHGFPTLLADGRVLFSRRLTGASGLFTVHVDGTGLRPFYVPHRRQLVPLDPRVQADGWVRFVAWDGSAPGLSAPWEAVWLRRPMHSLRRLEPPPEPGWWAEPRPRPQGHSSVVKPGATTGWIYCLSGYLSDQPVPPGSIAQVRFSAGGEVLGTIPVEADGSFQVEVPADTPLTLALLDRQGQALRALRSPIWVRPGERRGCVGCHEDRELAPPNRVADALRRPSRTLAGP